MTLVRALSDLSTADLSRIGGKARTCAFVARAGFDVPDGFVVHCDADAIPRAQIEAAVRRLGADRVAVRSSAVDEDGARHSFAGVHTSFLNVAPADVVEMVARCLSSMTGPSARAYRQSRGLPPAAPSQSVLVQRMVDAQVAGVAFTVDPVDPRTEALVISAARGSAEAVVDGVVDADEVRVNRATLAVTSHRVGAAPAGGENAPCLDAIVIRALSSLLLSLERALGGPQDVEWGHDGTRFWVLQSRPITTLATAPDTEWTRANVREILPDLPSPQSLDLLARLLNQTMDGYFGGLIAPDATAAPMLDVIGGRPYFNLTRLRQIARAALVPPRLILEAMGHADALRPDDHEIQPPPLGQFVRNAPTLLRILVDQALLGWRSKRWFAQANASMHDVRKTPMEDRSDAQLLALIDDFAETGQEPLCSAFTSGSFLHWHQMLALLCRRVDFPIDRLTGAMLAVGEKTVSSRQAFELLAVAQVGRADARVRAYFERQPEDDPEWRTWGRVLRGTPFKREVRAFIDTFGHRGIHETDWAIARFREDPAPIMFALSHLVTAADAPRPEDVEARLEAEARKTWDAFRAAVPAAWQPAALPFARWVLRRLKSMYLFRERNRFEMVRFIEPLREVSIELARRLVRRGMLDGEDDYFLLTVAEVRQALRAPDDPQRLRAIVSRRREEQARWATLDMPLLLHGRDVAAVLDGSHAPAHASDETRRLCGTPTSPGQVEAEVVILRDPSEFARMRRGAIIVAPATDPSWTPLFTLAAGVVVEIGGMLSHASTIAREYGLPMLANCRDATRLLSDGERVRLDATAGYLERLP